MSGEGQSAGLSPDARPASLWVDRRLLLAVLAVAAIVRAAALALWYEDLSADPDAYASLAVTLAESGTYGVDRNQAGEVLPSAYRPPLYPLILSVLTRHDFSSIGPGLPLGKSQLSLAAVAMLHWLLGVATVMLTMQIVAAVCSREGVRIRSWAAAVAGLAVAVDPILLRQSALVMTETLATFLAMAAWASFLRWEADRRWVTAVAVGTLFGLSVLCRPAAAVWAGLLLAVWLAAALFRRDRRLVTHAAIAAAATAMVWSPWIARNAKEFGRPIAMTTHGGYTLLLANNPVLFDHYARQGPAREWDEERFHRLWAARGRIDLQTAEAWAADPPSVAREAAAQTPLGPEGELREDAVASRAARETIRRRPGMFLLACVYRVLWLWAAWPARGAGGLEATAIGGWYLAWYAAAGAGLWRGLLHRPTLHRRAWWWRMLPGVTLALSVTAVHAVYWSNMRMRSVAMPAVYVAVASLGAVSIARRSGWPGEEAAGPTLQE